MTMQKLRLTQDEWLKMKAGKFTGSRVKAIAAGCGSQTAQNLLATMRWELRNGVCAPSYCNADMMRGIELEPFACREYEVETFETWRIVEPGVDDEGKYLYVPHPDYPYIGVSPDGLVDDDNDGPGLVEFKCPAETSAHLHQQHIESGYYAKAYAHQINLQLACTGRQWCDVVSYYPVEGEKQPLAIWRVERDDKAIAKLIKACVEAEKLL